MLLMLFGIQEALYQGDTIITTVVCNGGRRSVSKLTFFFLGKSIILGANKQLRNANGVADL